MSEKPSEYSFDEIELGMQKSFKVDYLKKYVGCIWHVIQEIITHYI